MSREQFEAWVTSKWDSRLLREWSEQEQQRIGDGYAGETLNKMWMAWQAAISSMQSERDQLAAQLAAVVAENAALKMAINSVTEISYHEEGMGCGLEDSGITDRYEAARYGWDEAISRIGEMTASETPATDRFLAEQRAVGIEQWIASRNGAWNGTTKEAEAFAAQLRNEVKGMSNIDKQALHGQSIEGLLFGNYL